ncbi:MAG: response regulator [Planctomyces sp.]|nr:response regulator [Planctomyces sp.]
MKPLILFIDDESDILDGFRRMLRPHAAGWRIEFINSPLDAWEFLTSHPVDAVVSDVSMPEMTGLQLLERIRSCPEMNDIPVTILTGLADVDLKQRVLDLGATDLLNKPVHAAELLARLKSMLRLKSMQDELKRKNHDLEAAVRHRTTQLHQSRLQILWRLGKAADFRDEDTGEHIVRVACYSMAIAETLGLPRDVVERLFLVAPLHDVGKIGIPDSILLKPGRLTDEERRVMQTHCEIGARILEEPSIMEVCSHSPPRGVDEDPTDPLVRAARDIAAAHHERWDGDGYPNRLRADEIPLAARIVSVADVYDALTSERPYKAALSPERSLEIVASGRGTQFDPDVIDAFLAIQPRVHAIRESVTNDVHRIMSSMTLYRRPELLNLPANGSRSPRPAEVLEPCRAEPSWLRTLDGEPPVPMFAAE